jgi:hypothetical protein
MPERLNAVITAIKPRFLQKTIQFNTKIEDAFNEAIHTNIAVFVPKLTPKYALPCIMVNVSNGRSSCLFRCENPDILKKHLKHMLEMLDTDLFKERWERIKSTSDGLLNTGYLAAYDSLYFKK